MKWFSNLRIGNRIILALSVQIVFWIAICSVAAAFLFKMKKLILEVAPTAVASTNSILTSFAITVLIVSLIFMLLAVFISAMQIKTIVEPLNALSESCILASNGVLEGTPPSSSQDEIGQVSRDLSFAFGTFISLIEDLKSLCEKHHVEGDVYAKINSDKYNGAYKETVEQLNAMIKQYIADARDVLYCINEFSNGNFDTQLRAFPGTRAVANNVHTGLRKSLASLSEDISRAISAVADGNFEIRVADSEYQGEWSVVAQEVNRLLDNISAPIRETTDAMLEIYEGNLSPKINGDFPGDFALVKTSSTNAAKSVSQKVKEIAEILSELSSGNTSVELKNEFYGDYAVIKTAIEKLLRSITTMLFQMREAAALSKLSSEKLSKTLNAVPASLDSLKETAPDSTASNVDDIKRRLIAEFGENRYSDYLFSLNSELSDFDDAAKIGDSLIAAINDVSQRLEKVSTLATSFASPVNELAASNSTDFANTAPNADTDAFSNSLDDEFNKSFDNASDNDSDETFNDSFDAAFDEVFNESFNEASLQAASENEALILDDLFAIEPSPSENSDAPSVPQAESGSLFASELEGVINKNQEIIENAHKLIAASEAAFKANNDRLNSAVKEMLDKITAELNELTENVGVVAVSDNSAENETVNALLKSLDEIADIPAELMLQSDKLMKACGGF